MFQPYMCGPSSGCGWTYSSGCTSMRVVVLGRSGTGSRSHITGYCGPGCIWLEIVFTLIGTISYVRGYNIVYRYNYLGCDKNIYNQ
jgi:hypothetical protein